MRVLVLSDVHGNLPALEAVLKDAGPVDAIWNLGDTVGYGPWPNECVARVASLPESLHLSGNHDLASIGAVSTEGFNAIAAAAAQWTASILTDESRAWLRNQPSRRESGAFTLAHGSPRDPVSEYIFSADVAEVNFSHFSGSGCFVGHTHVPMIAVESILRQRRELFRPNDKQVFDLAHQRFIVNPGGVGQPRDGNPMAAYAIVATEPLTASFHRVGYAIVETQQAIEDAGLPKPLADRLALGR
jgi:diadenosine tetraphosphatase ApaH/serine/threonine PP2A family protein phosphatase